MLVLENDLEKNSHIDGVIQNPTPRYLAYFYWLAAIYLSLIVNKIMTQIHYNNFSTLCNVTQGVVLGTPHWRAYQNRLLGPYIVEFISYIFEIKYCSALHLFNLATTVIAFAVLFFVLLRMSRMSYKLSFTYLIYFSVILLMIQHHYGYTWDNIDLIIFTILFYLILSDKPLWCYVVLFFVGILNKESALFISLFLMIYSCDVKLHVTRRIGVTFKKKQLLAGVIMLIVGAAYIKSIRTILFVSSSLDSIGADLDHAALGNHINFVINLKRFYYNFWDLNAIVCVNVFVVLPTLYLLANIKKYNDIQIKAIILYLIMLSSIFLFGLINETRMYTFLLPFLFIFQLSISGRKPFANTHVK